MSEDMDKTLPQYGLPDTAIQNGNKKIVEDLLKCGADVNKLINSRLREALTPLHSAACWKQLEMGKLLINYGANVNVKNGKGETPIVTAIRNGDTEMTELLLTNGADIKDNPELLNIAIEKGSLKIVKDLLKYGANVNFKDGEGQTPIVYAIQREDTEMIGLLVANGADIKDNPTLLYTAVKNGILQIVDDLLKHGIDVNMIDNSHCGLTPLHNAVHWKQVEMAKLLINYGANVNVKDGEGETPIVYAIRNGDTEMTELLLTNGADIKDNPELLNIAVEKGSLKIVKDLLKYGANVNFKDGEGQTPLVYAIQREDTEMIGLLVANGADIKDNPTLLYTAVKNGILQIVDDLLKHGTDVNMIDNSHCGLTPLHNAVHWKQVEMAKLLINYGANVNVKDGEGKTPLVAAIQNRDTKMMELLLTNGADIKEDPKVLYTAVEKGCLKIVEDILKHGADVNMLDNSNFGASRTPLHIAVKEMQVEMAKLLIKYGANVNVKDGEGKTQIVVAIQSGDTKMTKLLLTNGADIKKDPKVLYTAVQKGCLKIVEDILKHGADVNMLDNSDFKGLTPLHIAVKEKQVEMAELLIKYGANVNVNDSCGNSPIAYAIRCAHTEMIELLLTNGADKKGNPQLLDIAVCGGNLKLVEDLLKDGADSNMIHEPHYYLSPLCRAVSTRHVEMVNLLINYGANVNLKDSSGKAPICYAIKNKDTEMTKLLLTNGADIKGDPEIVCSAVKERIPILVEHILKHGADVNVLGHSYFGNSPTPLHIAVRGRQVEMAKLLINYGADVNVKDSEGKTPIVYATLYMYTEIIELLLTNGADINADPEILYTAVKNKILKIVEDLLKNSADVNMLYNSNFGDMRTPLHIAVKEKQVEMAKLLINYGANVNVRDSYGKTPIVYAMRSMDTEMIGLLLTNGADRKDDPEILCTAVKNGILKIVEDVLKDGTDVNNSDFKGLTPLHIAVKGKNLEMAKLLINYGANVNVKDGEGKTPIVVAIQNEDTKMIELFLTNGADIKGDPEILCAAVKNGIPEIVEDLLKDGTDINNSDFKGLTLLHSAVKGKKVEMAKLLINYRANVNVKDGGGKTAIIGAIQNRDTEMTELLLANGADIKEEPELLHTAVENGSLKIVELLLKYGADVNKLSTSRDIARLTPLHIAAKEYQVEVAKLLINYGANVNVKDSYGKTPIVYAIRYMYTEMIGLLLTNGADIKDDPEILCTAVKNGILKIVEDVLKDGTDVNNSDFEGLTPLHSAVKGKKVEMAKLLINYGANVNVKDGEGKTPIVIAIQNKDTKMIKLFLTNGADIKEEPELLHTAIENGSPKIVEDLLKYGADVNKLATSRHGAGLTPLHSVVIGKEVEMAKLLINYGADVNVKDNEGKTPIVYAIRYMDTNMIGLLLTNGADIKADPEILYTAVKNNILKIVKVLLKNGADVNMLCNSNFGDIWTPLHIAVKEKQLEMAKLLINYGANVNVKDSEGKTPIVFAIRNTDTKMIELFLTNGADIKEDPEILCAAVKNGILKIVEDLLKDGTDVNNSDFKGLTPLHSAVKGMHVEMAYLLIHYGANVNVKDGEGKTPIVYAIGNRDTKMIGLLLTNGADIKADPGILYTAVKMGNLKIVEDQLKYGVDVNMLDYSNFGESLTPLHSAVKGGKMEIAKLLIKYGANVNIKDSSGITPIVYAIRNMDTNMVGLFLTNGAVIKEDPKVLCTAVREGSLELVKDLLKYGADVNVEDGEGKTPIVDAIENTDTKMIKLLLANGADIKEHPEVLCTAVENGCLKIVQVLLNYGADVNASDQYGRTALHYTVLYLTDNERRLKSCCGIHMSYKKKIAELLLSKGANVNAKTKSGITTLFAASRKGYDSIVEILLKYGAECDPGAEEDTKPLHAAAAGGYFKVIENLLKFGAKVDSRDKYGRTALHIASRLRHYQIVMTLLEYGSDINIVSKNHTPLEYSRLFKDFDSDDKFDEDEFNVYEFNDDDDYHYNSNNSESSIDEYLSYMNDSVTTTLLKQHIAKMKAAGLYVSERNLLVISNDHGINNFLNACEAEIEIMKSEKIDNSCASFYDILTKSTSQLAKNECIIQALKSDDYKKKFPIYASMIDSRFRRG